jgi:FkbM family methyltransferase
MSDILGHFLRLTPYFRGKGRLMNWWGSHLRKGDQRMALLPDGSWLRVNMDVPYERCVWLQMEEWDELVYLRRKLRKGDIFLDVGANIGLWTLVAASAVGPEGAVLSFEPNPATYEHLVYHVRLNSKNGIVRPVQAAVSSAIGSVAFRCESNHNVSSIADHLAGPNVIQAATVTLDAAVFEQRLRGLVTGIKLDTEGHELAVLEGASKLLQAHRPWLVVEFNTSLLPSQRLGDWNVYEYLTFLGYTAARYDRLGYENPVDSSLVVRGYCNILFRHPRNG